MICPGGADEFFSEVKTGEILPHHRAVPDRMHYFGGETA